MASRQTGRYDAFRYEREIFRRSGFHLTYSRWTSSLPSCLWSQRIFPSLPGSRLTIFLSRCKFSTLTTRQPMIEFYLLTFSRFPLRKKEHESYFGKNRTHDFRTSRCAAYLLDHSGDEPTEMDMQTRGVDVRCEWYSDNGNTNSTQRCRRRTLDVYEHKRAIYRRSDNAHADTDVHVKDTAITRPQISSRRV